MTRFMKMSNPRSRLLILPWLIRKLFLQQITLLSAVILPSQPRQKSVMRLLMQDSMSLNPQPTISMTMDMTI